MPVDPSPKASSSSRLRRTAHKDADDIPTDSSYTREIELKRSRGEISCAECRRLKIRCDKTIPCQSCQRRGCAALCPNGSLATGQGTRFVLAATEHLHRRVAKMSERIRQLEDALAIAQGKVSNEPHPLLAAGQDIKTRQGDGTPVGGVPISSQSVVDAFGLLSISGRDVSTFFGPTGGTEYLLTGSDDDSGHHSPEIDSDVPNIGRDSRSPPASDAMLRFSEAFPFTPLGPPTAVYELVESHLPPYDRARRLAELYLEHAAWVFRGISHQQVMDEMLPFFYKRYHGGLGADPSVQVDYSGPHDLALVFFIFAIGALVDFDQEPYNSEAEHYDQLARAAFCLKPAWAKPGLTTIQALHLSSIYCGMARNELGPGDTNMEMTWGLLVMAAQISHSIGLHRDSARWELPEALVNRRRLLFWNIFVADSWQSLTTGRPPAFHRSFVDCQYPQGTFFTQSSETQHDFGDWFMHFAYECVSEVAMKTLGAEPPSYETIMELDRHVRAFPVPPEALTVVEDLTPPADSDPPVLPTSMQFFVISHCREVLMLYIHRGFFAQAILDCPENPVRSAYAHSFLSALRAASVIYKTVRAQFAVYPIMCARMWPVWTYAFSAAVVFGMVVARSPKSSYAAQSMSELNQSCNLFSEAARHSRRAAKALGIILRLQERARRSLAAVRGGSTTSVVPESPWEVKKEEDQDELEIFAGRVKVAIPMPSTQSQPSLSSTSSNQQAEATATSTSSKQTPVSYLPQQSHDPLAPYSAPASASAHSTLGPSGQQNWAPELMNTPVHPTQLPQSWYRQMSYTPHPHMTHGYAWTGQQHGHAVSAHQHQQGGSAPSQYHPPSSTEGYRHLNRGYPSPPAFSESMPQTPYVPPPELVDLGLASRSANLDSRWASLIHESGLMDDVHANYRS
ncbi:hypothetical protein WOLCODRAFT_26864 [Wolfiporia cocos MD-104 SS10]|uniref:Zn(2)-C6 fungal-type domain-containing protein n=1 Tax=Wolfiporia cocos (strain MD-104) TaxID=742152 RepID=A0A2H3JRL3_WOLCO|nr:hypothetical protein WOLCODRAFT_26864 [Wolfiporia cocos MD-104 SS10]